MKKILLSIFITISLFCFNNTYGLETFDDIMNENITKTYLVGSDTFTDDMTIEVGLKDKFYNWTTKLAGFFGLMAVLMLVYGSFLFVVSGGEEEKIKKAKDIIKWTLLGFLSIVLAGSIITVIIRFMYIF